MIKIWHHGVVIGTLILAGACASTDEVESNEVASEESFAAVSCEPRMSVFPVSGAHNIGYDGRTCNDGTCDVSCPDQNANSDWTKGDHHGIDVFAHRGAPLVAVADGTIQKVGVPSDTSGLRVRLRDACGWEYYYGHLEEAFVKDRQVVKAGDLIGTMGNSGTSGVHLHFNVSPEGSYNPDINPFDLLVRTSPTACGGEEGAPQPEPDPQVDPTPLACGALPPGGVLYVGQSVPSCDGRFVLVMQDDGNLVLYRSGGEALWSAGTHGTKAALVTLNQGDLEVLTAELAPVWTSQSWGHEGATLFVQDDGNVVVYTAEGKAIWNSGTCCQ